MLAGWCAVNANSDRKENWTVGLLADIKLKIERKKIENELSDFYALLTTLLLEELRILGVSDETIQKALDMAQQHVDEYFGKHNA